MSLEALRWRDGKVEILDQRLLPRQEVWITAQTWQEVAEAIRSMAVRGAPLIGVAAAYGLALAQLQGEEIAAAKAGLAATRPTAVNLFRAIERVSAAPDMLAEARRIEQEERDANERIGKNGAELVPANARILTICNTGSLATPGIGTALGIIRTAFSQGKVREVFSAESRPRMQGLRLTTYELTSDGIPFRAIADGAAGALMQKGEVDIVIAGADRIAANGDTANKIGTYSLAVLAKHHEIPMVIAAPSSTIDPKTKSGHEIEIEERDAKELTNVDDICVAAEGCKVWNPAFDVTPGEFITNIVTERGTYFSPYDFAGVFATIQP